MGDYLLLPDRGPLLISADLHGNGEDFRRLRGIFDELRRRDDRASWVLLGDLVHGPDPRARSEQPELYDFPDESWAVVEGVRALGRAHPGQVHLLLGNHDHAHVGGRHTSRFHRDEVRYLERQLSPGQRQQMHQLFASAALLALAPCGIVLCHGSPGPLLEDPGQLVGLSLRLQDNDPDGAGLLSSLLTSYGQTPAVTRGVLDRLGQATGLQLDLLVHGHERDEAGWFSESPHQLCAVIFGAPRSEKRYLLVDLGGRYGGAVDIRDGIELRRLYE